MSEFEKQELKAQLNRIERCLTGDSDMGQLGLVSRVDNHDGRLKRIERWVFQVVTSAALMTGLCVIIYKVMTDWWPHK